MRTMGLLAGAALALALSTSAYAQTPARPCCPAGVTKAAETEGAGKGPKVATTEGAGKEQKPTDKQGSDGTFKMADGTLCGACP